MDTGKFGRDPTQEKRGRGHPQKSPRPQTDGTQNPRRPLSMIKNSPLKRKPELPSAAGLHPVPGRTLAGVPAGVLRWEAKRPSHLPGSSLMAIGFLWRTAAGCGWS